VIGVTGATGGVGSRVLRALGAGAVGLARRPDAVAGARRADYDDPASLREAFAGLDTLVFISSDGVAETMRRHHENVVAAAVDARVGHVVYTSIIDIAADSRFYYSAVHRDTEALLAASGIDHCLVRTSIFSDFFVSTWIEPAVGSLAIPSADGRMSLVTRDDTARAVAAAAARRLEGAVDATGPAALTAAEVCSIAGLRHEPLSEAEYRARLQRDGSPAWLIEAFTSMFRSVREGRFERVSPTLTGEPAQSFADFLGD